MISRFCVDHPIFANVLALITLLLGGVAVWDLPVEQYPPITPPTVQVRAVYPGASAQTLADTIAAPIEQQVNGVERMLYMSSTCSSNDGSYVLTVTFDVGTDIDKAQVLVQNRVTAAEPKLPEEVRRMGVTVLKQSTDIILVISLTAPTGAYDSLFMANFANLRLRDELSRVNGVGDVRILGAGDYSMRIWLNPVKLRARRMTAQDVVRALRGQNIQVAAGQIGQPPAPPGEAFQLTINAGGRFSKVEQFRRVVVKTGPRGRVTYLKDVAQVELGGQSYETFSLRNGQEAATLLIFQLPGANALDVARGVKAAMTRLSRAFPPGLEHEFSFNTTTFVEQGIDQVYRTLIEAGVLVLIVILVFLQDWRAVLVPATTVPITIVGAFAFLFVLGFSVNFLTLFGLVLAIGIVVDDAIIIVENAAHHIERGEAPRQATLRAMNEVTGPVIGITLVLMAVFVPAAFLSGITGQLYRQFALTIAATALLSAINALTLKPAQCARYLRPAPPKRNVLARGFNVAYGYVERGYAWCVGGLLRWAVPTLLLFAVLLGLTIWWYLSVPSGFLPTEDQGYAIISVQLPDAASQQRTRAVVEKVQTVLHGEMKRGGLAGWIVLGGMSIVDGTTRSNAATIYVNYAPWEERTTADLSQTAILRRLGGELAQIQEAIIFPIVPPSIRGLGTIGGFQMQVEDRAGTDIEQLQIRLDAILRAARSQPEVAALNTTFRAAAPQVRVRIDEVRVKRMKLDLSDVNGALEAFLGSTYVNDFNKFGRTWQVRAQAAARFRERPEDVKRLEVRNRDGAMVPLGALLTVELSYGPPIIMRYNLYPSAAITGATAPGVSSGQALDTMEAVADAHLPAGFGFDWTGIAYQERLVGGQALLVFALAVLLVYLVLAAQYESWLLPLAVILVVPLGLLGAVAAVALRGVENDIYTQVGIVLIIALASKNAILIVEFARELRLNGHTLHDAALRAAQLRFRPILMTSIAFILGVVPLVRATGAGAASRQSLGTVVFGGMIGSTLLAVFFVPVFFFAIQWLSERIAGPPHSDGSQTGAAMESASASQAASDPRRTEFTPTPLPPPSAESENRRGERETP